MQWRKHFFSDAMADFEGLTYGKSRNLQAADGTESIANTAGELYGIALNCGAMILLAKSIPYKSRQVMAT